MQLMPLEPKCPEFSGLPTDAESLEFVASEVQSLDFVVAIQMELQPVLELRALNIEQEVKQTH
ncbi:hypothetical protein [Endozoicomonas arenosclerae]|uniref:hypothetical protein n=1 Tax=Endozoicomonas arenosclerae TaxID=1633495 RepID=UPI00129475D2|nr:hypothetical protein [Endozoicomonas arenosclerae]